MTEPPLLIPFLADCQVGGPQAASLTGIAAWTTPSPAGPSKRIALAAVDNTVWIYPAAISSPPNQLTLAPPETSLSASPRRPGGNRHTSLTSTRPRAASSASSILTSSSSRRRPFSPTSTAVSLPPAAQLSAAVASAAPPEVHTHRTSTSDRAELLDQLREQCGDTTQEERPGLGLGLTALGRRGLSGLHGKEDLESAGSVSVTGSATPRSAGSSDSIRPAMASRLSGLWARGSGHDDSREKIEEMAVEREMEREARDSAKEREDIRVVERAARSPIPEEASGSDVDRSIQNVAPLRIFLPQSGRGQIIRIDVFEDVGALVVLRDIGLLDIISLDSLQLVASADLEESGRQSGNDTASILSPSWLWKGVHLAAREEGVVFIVHGEPWPSPWPTANGEVTRVIMIALPNHDIVARLELPGVGDLGICSDSEASYLLHATITSLTSYPILFPGSTPPSRTPTPRPGTKRTSSSPLLRVEPIRRIGSLASVRAGSGTQNLPSKPERGLARFLGSRRLDRKSDIEARTLHFGLAEGTEVQRDGGGSWVGIYLHDDGQGIGLAEDGVDAFDFDGTQLNIRGSITLTEGKARDVSFTRGWHDICITTENNVVCFARDGPLKQSQRFTSPRWFPGFAACISSGSIHIIEKSLVAVVDLTNLEQTIAVQLIEPVPGEHICPMSVDTIIAADKYGSVRKQFLADYLRTTSLEEEQTGTDRLDAAVTCSSLVTSDEARGGRFFVAGDEDGAVRIWDCQHFRLRGSWTLFDDPVRSITVLNMPEAGILRGSVLCTSVRGSVGVISLREMEQLFILPAARALLKRVFIGGKDILVTYANSKARVWNVETQEFRRSTGLDSAEDMITCGGWFEVPLENKLEHETPLSRVVDPAPIHSDLDRLVQLDLRQLGRWIQYVGPTSAGSPLPVLRALLSIFMTFGVNPGIDEICSNSLGIIRPVKKAMMGAAGLYDSVTISYTSSAGAWRVSPTCTGLRQLAIVTLLRPFLDSPDLEQSAADVIAFYTAALPDDTVEPDLELFAAHYLDSASDVHQAARILFAARLARMPSDDIETHSAAQQSFLPSAVLSSERNGEAAARALTMIGGMALHRYQCINPTVLKSVTDSLFLYLHDPDCSHLALAIELCSKGFAIWCTYVDPMDVLRRLFYLSTHKDSSGTNIAAQARLAVLHIASSNAPLFMSTLSVDILDAKSVEHRTSIMKLCVFMARKRPAVLENGLPRIAEAVVKSLDPNVGKMRDDVWEAATVILNELVLAFSTIDFHPGTQRLAVGTHEGAVIMYDLKTASRLYVLEPHTLPVSAVTFSPDGRRLVTVSLEEGDVTVWKIGSSLSGLFNVGGPPRQGTERGKPFRRIPFLRADDVPLLATGALSDVQISWPGARQARVTIKETALTFET